MAAYQTPTADSGQNSLIPIAVYQDGTYYIQVGSEGTETGTYTVYVERNQLGRLESAPGYTRPGLPPGTPYITTSSEPDYEDLDTRHRHQKAMLSPSAPGPTATSTETATWTTSRST